MRCEPPKEITDLEAQIKLLQIKHNELHRAWVDSIAPFKLGSFVHVKKGRGVYAGIVKWQKHIYDGRFDYGISITRKNGNPDVIHIYSWDEGDIEAA